MRCPKCGRSNKEVRFIEQFCVDCYPLKIDVPEINIKQCTRCEKLFFKGEWKKYNLKDIIKSKIKGEFDKIDIKDDKLIVNYKGAIREYPINLRIEKTICPNCSRVSGGYFEAKIQVRGRNILSTAQKIYKRLSKKTAITKVEELKEGIDIYVVNSKIVPEVLKNLGYDFKMSQKLHTMIKGKRKYRTTFLVRR